MTYATVVIDDMAVYTGKPPRTGEVVELVAFAKRNTPAEVNRTGYETALVRFNKDVYLCNSLKSRTIKEETGDEVEVTYTITIDGKSYYGNDIFSPHELGLEVK